MGRVVLLALAFVGLMLLSADAQQERRVALVIGNGTYEDAGTLANPVNDAADMAAELRRLGFEVIEGENLGKRDLERKVGEFSDALAGAAVGLFFYAGHGLQVDGRNLIVPVDAKLDTQVKLTLETVPMDEVLDIMEQQTKVSLVFLDACRNNPFTKKIKSANRSAVPLPGLAQFDSTRGSFIAFSTAPGSVALDGAGRNSPFVSALLRHIAEPGQSISDLMLSVRRDVVAQTHDAQRPWEQGSLLDRFEFVPRDGAVAVAQPAPAASQPEQQQTEIASAERSLGGDAASIESFLRDGYLSPDADAMVQTVGRLYADNATIFGTPLANAAIAKVKSDWFAQWAGWTLALVPGSLEVTPHGKDSADAVFSMTYDYVPKANPAAHVAGKARITLGLVKRDGGWRIQSETSEQIQ
jgi:uncharacterized caspase-like protein